LTRRDTATFALSARRRLAEELAALPIFSVPRSSALLNYLAVLEVESLMSARSPLSVFGAHRQAVESSAHAIPAIFGRCPMDDSLPGEAVAEKVFNLAHDLFTFTHRYDQIDYSYRLAERGHWAISVAQKDPRITFSYASPEADQADTLARSREIQAKISHDQPSINVKAATETFMKLRAALAARTRPVQPEGCEYVIDDDVLSVMRDLAGAISKSMEIGMDADVKVGAFILLGLRRPQCVFVLLPDLGNPLRQFGLETSPPVLVLPVMAVLEQTEGFFRAELCNSGEIADAEAVENLGSL